MPDPKKRIIVDGFDFTRMFQFPRVVAAAASALQPPRLAIALLMVTALITIGRVWDAVTPHRINPQGLVAGTWSEKSDGARLQIVLRSAMNAFAEQKPSLNDPGGKEDLAVSTVLKEITSGYRAERAEKAGDEAKAKYDKNFESFLREIESVRPRGAFEATVDQVSQSVRMLVGSVLSLSPAGAVEAGRDLFIRTPQRLWIHQPWFVIVYGLIAMGIISIGGGAISRMAACQVANYERLSMREAADFALQHWVRLFIAQGLPLFIAAAICLVLIVMGVLMAAPVLDVIGGLLYGLALLIGFLLAFLLMGYALGFPMLVPAVACENCDAADAMQRSYAYVLTRPLHMLLYWSLALIGLALGFLLVTLLARVTLNVTATAFGAISDNPALVVAGGYDPLDMSHPTPLVVLGGWHNRWAAAAIEFWQMLVLCLIAAYVVSCHFSVSTVVYLLMRKASDGQDVEDIWREGLLPGTMAISTEVSVSISGSSEAAPNSASPSEDEP